MKTINLTSSQKSRLLEMCKILFPNDKVDYIKDNSIKFFINYYEKKDRNNDKITFGSWEKIVKIHWFEFCMTHLPVALYRHAMHCHNVNPITALKIITNNLMQFEDFGRYKIHPVDYLYKEFKKL